VKEDRVGDPIQRKGKTVPIKKHIVIIDIITPPKNPTFKRINRQIKEARTEIDKIKREELVERMKLNGLMEMYHETVNKAIFISKRF